MWNPNPSNSVKFRGETYALYFDNDQDFPGYQVIVLLSRASPAVEWTAFYTLLTGPWSTDVQLKGGWDSWIRWFMDSMNTAIKAHLGDSQPVNPAEEIPPPAPMTFNEFMAYLVKNLWFDDTGTRSVGRLTPRPVVTPPAPEGLFPLYGNRVFFGGYAFECGVEADGSPACRVQNNGWKRARFD